jgi:hypothetical protein
MLKKPYTELRNAVSFADFLKVSPRISEERMGGARTIR